MIAPEQQGSFVGLPSVFGIPSGNPGQDNVASDSFNNPAFENFQQQAMYPQERHSSTTVAKGDPSNFQFPQSTSTSGMGLLNMDDGIWRQMEKGRTGLTPGINLEELFGSDGGCNPSYMDQGFGRTQ